MSSHCYQDVIKLFESQFFKQYQTVLVNGQHEPIYLPRDHYCPFDRIIFAQGFFASALHEISHWCIAGEARRRKVDYGYWYCPDGRDQMIQQQFEQLEIAPQALDWLFCLASGYGFHVSCDNLNGNFNPDRIAFKNKIKDKVVEYLDQGIPDRAEQFLQRLHQFYHTAPLSSVTFLDVADLT